MVRYLYKGFCLKCQQYVKFVKPRQLIRKEQWLTCPSCGEEQLFRLYYIGKERGSVESEG